MFMLKSTHEAVCKILASELVDWRSAHSLLLDKHNSLVRRINAKGGEAFLKRATFAPATSPFSQDDLQRLIQLVHPDKHDGKQMAVEMTQKLIAMKEKMK